jgi:transcriptional regulator with XRE-family HTH domain
VPTRKPREKALYPNNLKAARGKANLKQAELVSICEGLARQNPDRFSTLSVTSLSSLENGYSRPQPKRAAALADALNVPIEELFPKGLEDFIHNPEGHTSITPGRKTGGRPHSQ